MISPYPGCGARKIRTLGFVAPIAVVSGTTDWSGTENVTVWVEPSSYTREGWEHTEVEVRGTSPAGVQQT